MTVFVALLRAVNVGGTGKLSMSDLRDLCDDAGFECVATYIQSGNVVFRSKLAEAKVKATLERALTAKMGKPASVLVRSVAELERTVRNNPFKRAVPKSVIVLFVERAPPKNALAELVIPEREKVEISGREIFVHYPDGMGRSKLKVPFRDVGTGRNMNTVKKLLEMARGVEPPRPGRQTRRKSARAKLRKAKPSA